MIRSTNFCLSTFYTGNDPLALQKKYSAINLQDYSVFVLDI